MSKIFKTRDYKPYNEIKPELDAEKEEYAEKREKEGLAEGETKGIDKGKREEKVNMAKKMLADNEDISKIVKYTGLTKKEINALRRTE